MNPLESPVFTEQVAFLKDTQYWERGDILDLQLKKLQRLVRYAGERIPFYHELLNSGVLRDEGISAIEDVRKFPLLSKKFLQDNYDSFLPFGHDKSALEVRTTGGSTGTPLKVYADMDFYARDKANTEHYMEVFGLDIFNYRSIRLYGDKIDSDLLERGIYWYVVEDRKLVMSCYHISKETTKTYVDKINEFKPRYIHTRPSSILPLANYIHSEKYPLKNQIEYIFCDGEYITDGQRDRVENVFGGRLVNIYGHTEGCAVGHPCVFSNELHFMPQVGIVELLDKGGNEVVKEGESGEMVVTGFNNLIFPLIRYRTGDIGILGNQKCKCGRNYKILRSVEGRIQDYVIDGGDNLIPLAPAVFNYNDMDWGGIREFKVIQERKGVLLFKILPEEEVKSNPGSFESSFKRRMEEILGSKFDIQVEFVSELNKTRIGKYRYLEQRLDLAGYFNIG